MLSQGIHTRRLSPTSAILAALLLAAASLFLLPSPAQAHDDLVDSDPAAGAVLDTAPEELTLTFSGELTDEEGATELQVTDASGTSLIDGSPSVDGTVVTQPLTGGGTGEVEVLWKVVGSDGHAISGELSFTIGASAPTASPTETTAPSPTETAIAPVETVPSPTDAAPVTTGSDSFGWVIAAIVAVLLVGGAIAYLVVSRRSRTKALSDGSASGSGTSAER